MRLPTSGYSNPTPGMDDSTHLTGEELEFLKSHMTAVEMRGTAAAELAAELGIAPGLSTTGTLGAGAESSVRVEFNPPAVVTKGVNEALAAGVVKYAQLGDWSAALRAGGERVAGEYTLNSFTQHGLSLTPGLKVKGNGFSAEVSALRQDFVYPPVQSQPFTGHQTKKLQEPQASASQK